LGLWKKRVNINVLAKWPGLACKTVYPGSIPGVASNNFNNLDWARWLEIANCRPIASQKITVCF